MKSIGSLGMRTRANLLQVVMPLMATMAMAAVTALSLGLSSAQAEPAAATAVDLSGNTGPSNTPGVTTRAAPRASVTLVPQRPQQQQMAPSAVARPAPPRVDFRGEAASPEALASARTAFERGDAQGLPFAVVDKKEAKLFVFGADGRLVGAAPALLGLARGDTVAPGVGRMVATGIPAALRTTPAGRYDSQPGPNLKGETVIWVDYDAAFAIHRLRPSPASERRAERLASPSPDDNRISLGCVVVAGEFFDRVVTPVLGRGPGVVYVLPEPVPAAVAQSSAGARL